MNAMNQWLSLRQLDKKLLNHKKCKYINLNELRSYNKTKNMSYKEEVFHRKM